MTSHMQRDSLPCERSGLLHLLAEVIGLPANDLTLDADIYDDLGIDSLRALKIVTQVEARLDVVFDDAEIADVRTVEQFIRMVEGVLAMKT